MQSYESHLNGDLNWALLEGSMHFEGNSTIHRTQRRLATRLDAVFSDYGGVDYAIVGGMALFFHGSRRFTELIFRLDTVLNVFLRRSMYALNFLEMAGCRVGTNGRGLVLVL
jgi:hypothetical protein